jgi:hypothetical protein
MSTTSSPSRCHWPVSFDPTRQTAAERLTTLLGADLLAAIYTDLRDLDVTTIPLATRPRRVA